MICIPPVFNRIARGTPLAGVVGLSRQTGSHVGITSRFRSSGLLRQGALVFGASMFLAACGFLYQAIASRALGVQQYGSLYALISAFTAEALPGAVIAPVIVRFAAEFRALRDDSHLRGLGTGVAAISAVFAVAIVMLSILLAVPVGSFLHVAPWLVPLIGIMAAFGFASSAFRSFIQGMQAYKAFGASCVAEGTLRVAALVLFVTLGLGMAWGAVAFIVGFAASMVCLWIYLIRRFANTVVAKVKYDWRRIAVAGGGAAALTISTTLLGSFDVVLVKHYFDASQAGIYSIASLVGKILLYFVGFIPIVLLPQATDRHSRGERTRFVLGVCLTAFALVALCGLTFFHFFGLFVLHVLAGHAYDAAAGLLVPYGGAMVCLSLIGALGTYGIATHRMLFSIPLLACTAGILIAIALHHPTLAAVVHIMLTGMALTMLMVAAALAAQGLAGERAKARFAA